MAEAVTSQLGTVIEGLRVKRQKYMDAIAEIDGVFAQHGIKTLTRRRRGRPAGVGKKKVLKKAGKRGGKKNAAKRGRKKVAKKGRKVAKSAAKKKSRKTFSKTADQFVLDLVKGGKKLTTAEINGKWRQARRGGTVDNTLMKLTKDGQLKRESIDGARGSRYSTT